MPHKLTPRIYSRILNSARGYFDSSHHKTKTEIEYFRLFTQKGIIACYRCGIEIRIGEEYETNHKYGRGNSRKYYHTQCYKSLYQ